MSGIPLLLYLFGAFLVGMVCLGAALVLGLRRDDPLPRAFLVFYLPFSLVVLTTLALAFAETGVALPGWVPAVAEYLESLPGRYAIMLVLPLFAHRVYGLRDPRRDALLGAVVGTAFVLQHLTEYVLGGAWDPRGDVAEDILFAVLVVYTLAVALGRRDASGVYQPLGRRFRLVLLAWIPGGIHDVFFADGPGLRLYPLLYGVMGVTIVVTLLRRTPAAAGQIPEEWSLTPREEEVAALVCEGLTNGQIASRLSISRNTVKTHVASVYDKSGHRNRMALLASLARGASDAPPDDEAGFVADERGG